MPITVKQIVGEIVASFKGSEIEVEYIEKAKNDEIERSQIVNALKELEADGLGVFMVGRRKKSSRFIKGVKRAQNIINKDSLDKLREEINKLSQGDVMLASFNDAKERANEDQLAELEDYKDKICASQFFNDNTAKAVDALKLLQEEGLGSFVIGRRGKFSRFVKGVSKDELQTRPKGLIPVEDFIIEERNPKYNVIHNLILRTYDSGEFDNLHEAMNKLNIEDSQEVESSINKLGYYQVS